MKKEQRLKILKHNDKRFLADLKRVRGVVVFVDHSECFLACRKNELAREAEEAKIEYYISDAIYKVKREVMVVI